MLTLGGLPSALLSLSIPSSPSGQESRLLTISGGTARKSRDRAYQSTEACSPSHSRIPENDGIKLILLLEFGCHDRERGQETGGSTPPTLSSAELHEASSTKPVLKLLSPPLALLALPPPGATSNRASMSSQGPGSGRQGQKSRMLPQSNVRWAHQASSIKKRRFLLF